jgi:hypothetical protein
VPGRQQEHDRGQELVGPQPVPRVLGRDQGADQVGARRPPAFLEQRQQVGGEGHGRPGRGAEPLGCDVGVEDRCQVTGVLPEQRSVVGGDPEQLADHRHGQREGEVVDDVEPATHHEGREDLVRQLLDAPAQPVDRARREGLAHQPTHSGVVRCVHEEQHLGEHLPGELGELRTLPVAGEPRRVAVVAAPPRTSQHGLHGGV